MLEFTIPGSPVAKGRPKLTTINGMARAYTPSKTRNYEALVRLASEQAMAGRPLFDCPLGLTVSVFIEPPASWSKKRRVAALAGEVLPTKRPDVDNYIKAILDGMNSVVFADDARIVDLVVKKRFSESPSVVVAIVAVPGDAA